MGDPNYPNSRQAAKTLGVSKYSTGKPCGAGHMSPRYTQSGTCCACVKTANDSRQSFGLTTIKMDVHPDDAEAARSYLTALNLQRGILAKPQPGKPTPAPALVDIAAARAHIFASVIPAPPPPLPDWDGR